MDTGSLTTSADPAGSGCAQPMAPLPQETLLPPFPPSPPTPQPNFLHGAGDILAGRVATVRGWCGLMWPRRVPSHSLCGGYNGSSRTGGSDKGHPGPARANLVLRSHRRGEDAEPTLCLVLTEPEVGFYRRTAAGQQLELDTQDPPVPLGFHGQPSFPGLSVFFPVAEWFDGVH